MLDYARTMARYNRWMNERLYAACASLPEQVLKRDAGAFFRSIHGTLNHLLLVDRLWMGRFLGEPYAVTALDQELHADFEALRSDREQEDLRILDWADNLGADRLAGELAYTSLVDPQRRRLSFRLAVTHFFNHQTHHRGQITTLLAQQGVDMGVTDLIRLPRAER